MLRHGHTAESCCPPVSGDSAPTTRNAATFLVHPDPTAIFTCPTQNQERGFQKKNVYSGQMHFASFLLLSGVWCQGRRLQELHTRYEQISNFCQPLWSCVSQTSTEPVLPTGLGCKHCLFLITQCTGKKTCRCMEQHSHEKARTVCDHWAAEEIPQACPRWWAFGMKMHSDEWLPQQRMI